MTGHTAGSRYLLKAQFPTPELLLLRLNLLNLFPSKFMTRLVIPPLLQSIARQPLLRRKQKHFFHKL